MRLKQKGPLIRLGVYSGSLRDLWEGPERGRGEESGREHGKRRRSDARHAGHAGAEGTGTWGEARIWRRGMDPRELERRIAGGGGRALPGAPPVGAEGAAGCAVGHVGEQPAGQVLLADAGGTQETSGRSRVLAADVRRDRESDADGLRNKGLGFGA